jgi:hypothetical protein
VGSAPGRESGVPHGRRLARCLHPPGQAGQFGARCGSGVTQVRHGLLSPSDRDSARAALSRCSMAYRRRMLREAGKRDPERLRADDGRATFPDIVRTRQLVEHVTGFVEQVRADDVPAAEVDEVPVVDAVMTPQVELVQLLAAERGRALAANRAAVRSPSFSPPGWRFAARPTRCRRGPGRTRTPRC